MTWYREIEPLQSPNDFNLRVNGRPAVVFNLRIIKTKSTTLAREIVRHLERYGLGTLGVDLFGSSDARLPSEGTFVHVKETGGAVGIRVHNEPGQKYVQPTVQITVVADTYELALARAWPIHDLLGKVRNMDISLT